ncbi:FixH family protein [Moheibacter sediminis]|uniref:FixH protein n=1 Tax=Moheibacter sediminis TaxID=1434700 RepID=A0A1W1YIK6_9FLAO|nr:FixH family protein [Moheibacter sediminis]SMC35999.1 FixH protein [Moheibacter sediminis]
MKFTWGHGIMVALGCFMIFILSLIFFSGDMGEMVTEDYYEKTINYQDDIDAVNRANALAVKPQITQQANGFMIHFDEAVQSGDVFFLRSENSKKDIVQPLKLNAKNEMLIHSVDLINGEYEVSLRWKQNNQNYLVKERVNWKAH